jgi:ketosteroid isomerase-like protein
MSQQNVELVKRAIVAAVSVPPDADAVATLMHRLAAIAETDACWQSWRQDIERVLDAGENGVVVFLRLVAVRRQSGAPVDFPWAMVVTLSDGKIASSQVFLDRSRALKAVGLSGL